MLLIFLRWPSLTGRCRLGTEGRRTCQGVPVLVSRHTSRCLAPCEGITIVRNVFLVLCFAFQASRFLSRPALIARVATIPALGTAVPVQLGIRNRASKRMANQTLPVRREVCSAGERATQSIPVRTWPSFGCSIRSMLIPNRTLRTEPSASTNSAPDS